jgi:hypothetical protein
MKGNRQVNIRKMPKFWVVSDGNLSTPASTWNTLNHARADVKFAKKQNPKVRYTIYRVQEVSL